MLSKSNKILMSLNSKERKSHCQLATTKLIRQRTGKQQENDKSEFGSDALD